MKSTFNRIKLFLLLVFVPFLGFAQDNYLPLYTQYNADNPLLISSAYAGIGSYMKFRLNGSSQWVGVENAPATHTLTTDFRVGNQSGIGLVMYNDQNGYTSQHGARFGFAHHLTLDPFFEQYLSFGISYQYDGFSVDTSEIGGMFLDTYRGDENSHNFEVSALYRRGDFFMSVAIANLLPREISVDDEQLIKAPNQLTSYGVYTGYSSRKRNQSFVVEPSVFFQYFPSDKRSVTDLHLKIRWRKTKSYSYVGVSSRVLNEQFGNPLFVAPMFGMKKGNLFLAYSYQINTNTIFNYSSGSHQITLGLDIKQKPSACKCTY